MLKKEKCLSRAFLLGLLAAAVIFVPFMILDKGYFLFYGDFNVQQVPFYKMCHDAVRSGDIFWNWNTDLGANFIGSYSFYLLGSPFFWLTLPFPSEAVPYLMGPLLILKFACASLTGCAYIRLFVKKPQSAVIGGLLYAFSGFSVYNIFFNHFHEAIIFFPLLLISVELSAVKRKHGLIALAVAICAVANYFFFAGMMVFLVIYCLVRVQSDDWLISPKWFCVIVFEILLGVAMAAVILLPSFYSVTQMSRPQNLLSGWDTVLYSDVQRYLYVIQSFFFPPDLPSRPVFFTEANAKWSSVAGWLPLFGMTGVLSLGVSDKKHRSVKLLCISFVMAMVPILNAAFYLFNESYYARWFYMPVLMAAAATATAIERTDVDWKRGIKLSAVITAVIAAVVGLTPNDDGGIGLFDHSFTVRFIISCAVALASVGLTALLVKKCGVGTRRLFRAALALVLVVSVSYSVIFIATGKEHSNDTRGFIIPECLEYEDFELPDEGETFRVDVYDGMDNQAMFWQLPSIQAFHSIVPASVTDFYAAVGIERGVASTPDKRHYPLRSLFSVRWLFDYAEDDRFINDDGRTAMPFFEFYDRQNGFNIYENTAYIPMGFTYDEYIVLSELEKFEPREREFIMLEALAVPDELEEQVSGVLRRFDSRQWSGVGTGTVARQSALRAASSADSFTRDNRGFSARISLETDDYVFFSVPYESGWRAYVNGEKAEIISANVGFMAVKAEAGENDIRFEFFPEGLGGGIVISCCAVIIFALFCAGMCILKRRGMVTVETIENDEE